MIIYCVFLLWHAFWSMFLWMLQVKSGTYLVMPDAWTVYLSIRLTYLALPFLPWHWIHHPSKTLCYQHLNSPITIQHSMGPHKLIMPMFSKDHWLLREAKAGAWVNLSLDLLGSAGGVCIPEGPIVTINYFQLCACVVHKFCYQQSMKLPVFSSKAYLVKNDWWREVFIARMIEERNISESHVSLSTEQEEGKKLNRAATHGYYKTTNKYMPCSLSSKFRHWFSISCLHLYLGGKVKR